MPKDATAENLSAAVVETMKQARQGDQWYVDRNTREAVDFEYCYPIIPIPQAEEAEVFIKQKKYRVRATDTRMAVSDILVAEYLMPKRTLFRLYPVDLVVDRLGDEDHAYSLHWTPNRHYWFDIVHDLAKDPNGRNSKEIRMVNAFGRVETMVVPRQTDIRSIGAHWRRIFSFTGRPQSLTAKGFDETQLLLLLAARLADSC
jgi:hypothetical protein